ncbi:hypothetical protein MFIFM68171_02499 [Madurella fahalii]|uniref:RRM domain-containing protein n=1 Tax=Madurella fahalii TaxID=1157608 RepID=A0ABQ0G3F6_9PEZI
MARPGDHGANSKSASGRSHAGDHGGDLHGTRSVDSDDREEASGGVSLRDFDRENKSTSARTGGATGSRGHGNTSFSTPNGKTAASNRGNNIAAIGTGRFSEYTENAGHAGPRLNASLDTLLDARNMRSNKDSEQTKTKGATAVNHNAAPIYHQADTAVTGYPFGYAPVGTAYGMNLYPVPSYHGGMMYYPQGATAIGYPYGSDPYGSDPYGADQPEYITAADASYGTQQSNGLATPSAAAAPRFQRVDQNLQMTPSHATKQGDEYLDETPQPTVLYNQTEPRNFAPRTGIDFASLPPPPAFNLGCGANTRKNDASYSAASDSDPFSSDVPTEDSTAASASQALVLSSVSEDDQVALVPYPGFFGPVPAEIRALRSDQLNALTDGPSGLPTQEAALSPDNFPFIESCSQAAPVSYGVVKLRNIPFGTKRAEIIAFLGRNSKILNDNQEPVHIIMERVTSKTQDAYVEFMSLPDAMRAVERHQLAIQKGRNAKLGDRPVEVQLSSQSALMKDLFPLASGVFWEGSKPVIQGPIEGQPWKTFKGFVTEEEMTMLVKHVEIPQRSPYAKECPQRPYECMISTIKKLPWYMSKHITVRQRHAVYYATERLVTLLIQALQRDNRQHETTINEQLLKRLVTAAMLCPGFSVVQKDNIAVIAHMDEERTRMFNQPRFADMWTHLYALCPKPGIPLDVLEWYIAIVREESTRFVHSKPLNEQSDIEAKGMKTNLYFGYMWHELDLPSGREFDKLTLRELARRELVAMERALRRALPVRK